MEFKGAVGFTVGDDLVECETDSRRDRQIVVSELDAIHRSLRMISTVVDPGTIVEFLKDIYTSVNFHGQPYKHTMRPIEAKDNWDASRKSLATVKKPKKK
jgi:hypothetical protein